MGWAAVRRPRGILLPQGAGPAGCTPHFLFPLVEKKTGRARSKRKDRLDALRRVRASARRGSADRCKRRFWPAFGHAMLFCDFCNCRPVADGAEVVGVVIALSLLLFSLPLAAPRGNWRSGPIKASAPTEIPSALRILWGPTCVSALARVTKATSPVGADALVRPPAQAATTAQAARSDCAAVGGSAVLRMRRAPCGQAERAEGGASGTLVTEIRGAPQRETGKEERFKCARVLQSKTHYAAGIRR